MGRLPGVGKVTEVSPLQEMGVKTVGDLRAPTLEEQLTLRSVSGAKGSGFTNWRAESI